MIFWKMVPLHLINLKNFHTKQEYAQNLILSLQLCHMLVEILQMDLFCQILLHVGDVLSHIQTQLQSAIHEVIKHSR